MTFQEPPLRDLTNSTMVSLVVPFFPLFMTAQLSIFHCNQKAPCTSQLACEEFAFPVALRGGFFCWFSFKHHQQQLPVWIATYSSVI